jgi:glycosyltransferase involved in cell wall biosynthesis
VTSISACLIVRDVESVLERCLESIDGVYHELCIVDTGSSDRTPEIARTHADRFRSILDCNDQSGKISDFAAARNHCLDLASGEWIFSIDADEVFTNRSDRDVRDILSFGDATAVAITMARGETEWLAIRIFRNMPTQRFRHRVHETVRVAGDVLTVRELRFRDLGQQNKPETSAERNVRMCASILGDDPTDLRAAFYLAEGLRKLGRYHEAGQAYLDCLEHDRFIGPYRWAALESLGVCFLHLERWRQALDAARMAARLRPDMAENYCLMGDAYLAMHDIARAKAAYLKAARQSYPPEGYSLFVRKSSYRDYPLEQLGAIRKVCEKNGIDYDKF